MAVVALGLAGLCCSAHAGRGFAGSLDDTGVREALRTVELNRTAIVARLVATYGADAVARRVAMADFHAALLSLRAENLLAASLVGSFDDVAAIVFRQAADDVAQVEAPFQTKDGPGSGPNSWIGYTAGGNVASGSGSAVAAGTFNLASGQNSFVAAGQSNVAAGTSSLVIGGFDNGARVVDSLVGGGAGNRATGARSVVVGGGYNLASGQWSFVGGGGRQSGTGVAGTYYADNVAAGDWSTVGGGIGNRAGTPGNGSGTAYATVAGGQQNAATKLNDTVGGGGGNIASGGNSTVGGGFGNDATGYGSAIAGGQSNTASGSNATIPGGAANVAAGSYSFAAGVEAKANYNGCFVWADFSSPTSATSCFQNNEFVARALGGFWFLTAGTNDGTYTGASLAPGAGAWSVYSDRNGKDDVRAVDTTEVLRKVMDVPVATWNWKGQDPSIRHMGPMAQDFHAAFGLGERPTAISTVDADGVALAAIQGLKRELDVRAARIEALERRLKAIERRIGVR